MKHSCSKSGFFHFRLAVAIALCSIAVSIGWFSFAGTPSSGTLSLANPVLTYDAGPFNVPNQSPLGLGQLDVGPRCDNTSFPCDNYTLTVTLPAGYAAAHPNAGIKVSVFWNDTGSHQSEYDLYVYNGVVSSLDGSQPPNHASTSADPEVTTINPVADGTNKYSIFIVPYIPTQEVLHARIELLPGDNGITANFGSADPSSPGVPRYHIFEAPESSSADPTQGEFNIGFNPHSGRIMVMNNGPVWRLTPGEIQNPAKPECCEALWEDRSTTTANIGLDPILWTDQLTGRTFVSNSTAGANAVYAYTDSDGEPTTAQPTGWTEFGVGAPNGGADHETLGSGPYPAALPWSGLATPQNQGHAVYYCSQDVVGPASCYRSDSLGASWGPGVMAYTGNGVTSCGGLHGHLHVAPDGTAWLPVRQCAGQQGGALSTTAGTTWTEFVLPGSHSQPQGADPSIAIDSDNTIYYAYVNNEPVAAGNPPEGHPRVRVGHRNADNSVTWGPDIDLGASHGIRNAVEIEAVGGSSGRAAVGFLGSDANGDYQSNTFPGKWYAFIATTYDGGQTWKTVNATPNDPVQSLTGVWQQGGSQPDRNLLDFNEITIDDKGHVLYGYSDGCVTPGCIAGAAPNDYSANMRVARQSGGKTLLASYDPNTDTTTARLPKPACLSGLRDPSASHLTWKVPDNGGSDIVKYEIWRGNAAGAESKLFTTVNADPHYTDLNPPSDPHLYYYVKAINAVGTGSQSNEIDLVVQNPPTHCKLPGILAVTDLNPDGSDSDSGQNTPPDPRVDVKQVFVAEPFFGAGVNKLVFTIQMAASPTLTSPPPSSQWYLIWNRQSIAADGSDRFYVAMKTDATGATSFEYGNFGPPLPLDGSPPAPNANTPTKLGDASGTYDAAGGVITITIPNSVAENVHAGQTLSALNVRTYLARPDAGQKSQNNANDITADGSYTLVGNAACQPAVNFTGAASRMLHNSTPFDLPLPQSGNVGIECRSGGPNKNYTMVFKFANPIASVAGVNVTEGTGTPTTTSTSSNGLEYIVNLTGVNNAQKLTVTLTGVTDTIGGFTASLPATMGVLIGDVDGTGRVDGNDVSAVQSHTRQSVNDANFRYDVSPTGRIDGNDVSATQSQTRTGLP